MADPTAQGSVGPSGGGLSVTGDPADGQQLLYDEATGTWIPVTPAAGHTQGTDQTLDLGGANEVAVADIKDAVSKAHNTHAMSDVTGLPAALSGKMDDVKITATTWDVGPGETYETIADAFAALPPVVRGNITFNLTGTLASPQHYAGFTFDKVFTGTEVRLTGTAASFSGILTAQGGGSDWFSILKADVAGKISNAGEATGARVVIPEDEAACGDLRIVSALISADADGTPNPAGTCWKVTVSAAFTSALDSSTKLAMFGVSLDTADISGSVLRWLSLVYLSLDGPIELTGNCSVYTNYFACRAVSNHAVYIPAGAEVWIGPDSYLLGDNTADSAVVCITQGGSFTAMGTLGAEVYISNGGDALGGLYGGGIWSSGMLYGDYIRFAYNDSNAIQAPMDDITLKNSVGIGTEAQRTLSIGQGCGFTSDGNTDLIESFTAFQVSRIPKLTSAQLPDSVVGAVQYQGSWNADTNVPEIPAASASNQGHYYIVSVSGATEIDGESGWGAKDWIISDGTAWAKVDNTDPTVHTQGTDQTLDAGGANEVGVAAIKSAVTASHSSHAISDVTGLQDELDAKPTMTEVEDEIAEKSLDSHRYPVASQDGDVGSLIIRASAPIMRDENGDIRGRAYPDESRLALENKGPIEFNLSDGSVNGIANGDLDGDWPSPSAFPVTTDKVAAGIIEYDQGTGVQRAVKGTETSAGSDIVFNDESFTWPNNYQNKRSAYKLTNNTGTNRAITAMRIKYANSVSLKTGYIYICPDSGGVPDYANKALVGQYTAQIQPLQNGGYVDVDISPPVELLDGSGVWIVMECAGFYVGGGIMPSGWSSYFMYWNGTIWTTSSSEYNDKFYAKTTEMSYGAPAYPAPTAGWTEVAKLGTPTYPITGGSTAKLVERPYTQVLADSFDTAPEADEAPFATTPQPMHLIEDIDGLQGELDDKSDTTHDHDDTYSALGHDHDDTYSALGHNHDSDYAPVTLQTTSDPSVGGLEAAIGVIAVDTSNVTAWIKTGAGDTDWLQIGGA